MHIKPNIKNQITDILDRWYDRGKPVRMEQVLGGYTNQSYAVWLEKGGQSNKYLLRRYNPNIAEKEIRFEHALIRHLRDNGFSLVADVIGCRDSGTFVQIVDEKNFHSAYWSLFEFVDGEDKYSWTQTNLDDKELASAAEILARLHFAGRNFRVPPGAARVQPPIMEFLATIPSAFNRYALQARDRRADRIFLRHLDQTLSTIHRCLTIRKNLYGLLELPIHCDYHPGNLKYQDFVVVGVFDFDWSKIDYRLFDVALALVYFVSVWNDKAGDSLHLYKFELFLKTYNDTCRKLKGIDRISPTEERFLVPMLAAANLYVLNWDLMDFYGNTYPDDDEYFTYIDHGIRLMHWIETQGQKIEAVIRRLLD